VLNTGIVSNTGSINQGTAGGTLALAGNAASAAVTAVGAQALASITGVDATGFAGTLFGAGGISQNVGNNADSTVTNTLSSGGITLDAVSGIGASVSASASGAVASVGITYINVGGAGWTPSTVGDISQTSTNADGSNVANNAISNPITVAGISGDGASVRASASGAIASVSLLTIDSTLSGGAGHTVGAVTQSSTNGDAIAGATVTNTASITAGAIGGVGASAVINATGASASFSIASINDISYPASTTIGTPITQTATNYAGSTVSNTGSITLTGGLTGVGSSAAVSAVGAGTFVSFAAIK
jgi:hypothetical protein